jgi:hypothetical protein
MGQKRRKGFLNFNLGVIEGGGIKMLAQVTEWMNGNEWMNVFPKPYSFSMVKPATNIFLISEQRLTIFDFRS